MGRISISETDRDRISAAVRDAETRSNGEIVTVITSRSDAYHDVGLHYATAAMLSLLALVAAYPNPFIDMAKNIFGGWNHDLATGVYLSLLLGAQIIIFLVVRYTMAWMPLRMALTPSATKSRRVRRRAVTLYRSSAEGRTAGRTAILVYLSLAERRAEIIADQAISTRVKPERWGDAMAELVSAMRDGRPADGMVEAIKLIGTILSEQLPKTDGNPNELPDRLIEL